MEEGLFPSARSMNNAEDLEEERRLCYVAITRAKKHLYITGAQSRTLYGQTTHQVNSRFLGEIPSEFLVEDGMVHADRAAVTISQMPQKIKTGTNELFRRVSSVTSAPKADIDFSVGDRVMHKKFGKGTVKAVQRFEKDAMLEILFDSGETKRLMAVFAKLTKI